MKRISRRILPVAAALLVLAALFGSAAADPGDPAVGDILVFGHYEQDNDQANGPEPIEWIVLDVDTANRRALVISRFGLDALPYNEEAAEADWQSCSLRAWLNGTFLTEAFSEAERAAIPAVMIDNGIAHDPWNEKAGENTTDRVFLLSLAEKRLYFPERGTLLCAPTDHALANGAYASSGISVDGRGAGVWWFRSSGHGTDAAFGVPDNADFGYNSVTVGIVCVRPALYIDLDAGID